MTTPKICPRCGKEFAVTSRHSNQQFCCKQCWQDSKRETVQCPGCGTTFIKFIHSPQKFCSQSCAFQHKAHRPPNPAKKTIFICKWCGKEFEEWAYRNPTMCSRQCAAEYGAHQPKLNLHKIETHITRKCVICGEEYQTTTHQLRLRGSSCCSRECVSRLNSELKRGAGNPNYRGGTIRYRGANWGAQSRKALRRDGYCCQICHKKLGRRGWDYGVHHIKPYREFKGDYYTANQLSNLVTLCRSCHSRVEAGKLACPQLLL